MHDATSSLHSKLRVIFSLLLCCVVATTLIGGSVANTRANDVHGDRIEPADWLKVATVRATASTTHGSPPDTDPDGPALLETAPPRRPDQAQRVQVPALASLSAGRDFPNAPIRAPPCT